MRSHAASSLQELNNAPVISSGRSADVTLEKCTCTAAADLAKHAGTSRGKMVVLVLNSGQRWSGRGLSYIQLWSLQQDTPVAPVCEAQGFNAPSVLMLASFSRDRTFKESPPCWGGVVVQLHPLSPSVLLKQHDDWLEKFMARFKPLWWLLVFRPFFSVDTLETARWFLVVSRFRPFFSVCGAHWWFSSRIIGCRAGRVLL